VIDGGGAAACWDDAAVVPDAADRHQCAAERRTGKNVRGTVSGASESLTATPNRD
jgi:hypothetical protein